MDLRNDTSYSGDPWYHMNASHSFTGNETFAFDPNMTGVNIWCSMFVEQSASLDTSQAVIRRVVVPIICIFGMVGNILTLLILTRKRLKSSVDGTERTVHIGLTALAASDLMFCVCLLPHGMFKTEPFYYRKMTFQLVYRTYGDSVLNTFILTSTWLTVTMATGRYLAICHPFKARHIIGMTGTKASILLVWLLCVLFNIPRMFETYIKQDNCQDGGSIYMKASGPMGVVNSIQSEAYSWFYFTFGIFIPLTMLAFCNICLVKALRKSSKLRKRYRVPTAHVDSNHRITSILVTIVVMYIFLVSPAEILLFFKKRMETRGNASPNILSIAGEVTNVLQAINFSCNFVMYFILNVHFRQAMKDILYKCLPCLSMCQETKGPKKQMLNRSCSARQSTMQSLV